LSAKLLPEVRATELVIPVLVPKIERSIDQRQKHQGSIMKMSRPILKGRAHRNPRTCRIVGMIELISIKPINREIVTEKEICWFVRGSRFRHVQVTVRFNSFSAPGSGKTCSITRVRLVQRRSNHSERHLDVSKSLFDSLKRSFVME